MLIKQEFTCAEGHRWMGPATAHEDGSITYLPLLDWCPLCGGLDWESERLDRSGRKLDTDSWLEYRRIMCFVWFDLWETWMPAHLYDNDPHVEEARKSKLVEDELQQILAAGA